MAIRCAKTAALLALLVLSGCAHVISGELRVQARQDLTFPMVFENPEAFVGSTVVWGGVIVETRNRRDGTDLIILKTPLDYGGFPLGPEHHEGRFIAWTPRFLDPEVFAKGRKVTVGGVIDGAEKRPLGEMEYTYPVVEIRELHLWEAFPRAYYRPYPPPYLPWYWWDGYWCPWPGCF